MDAAEMNISLFVPSATPSLNTTIRMHWSKRKKIQVEWAYMLLASWREIADAEMIARKDAGKKHMADICIERYGSRCLDYDNLVGGAKEVVTDNLIKLGFIDDDNQEKCRFSFHSKRMKKKEKPHTIVRISYQSREIVLTNDSV